jgi:hypothetical protein
LNSHDDLNWLGGLLSEGLIESLLPNYIFLPGISFVEFHKQGWILSYQNIRSSWDFFNIATRLQEKTRTPHFTMSFFPCPSLQETFYTSFALWSLEEN